MSKFDKKLLQIVVDGQRADYKRASKAARRAVLEARRALSAERELRASLRAMERRLRK